MHYLLVMVALWGTLLITLILMPIIMLLLFLLIAIFLLFQLSVCTSIVLSFKLVNSASINSSSSFSV